MSNPNQPLYDALRRLDAAGHEGFEGLIAKLLESLTGKRFFLAKSGFQGGRDMSTEGRNANAIAAECKRYKDDTNLDERQLLGELEQVAWDTPDLDLWILVASRPVPAQLATALVRSAQKKGFEAFIIDTVESDGNFPSFLATLCAHKPDLVLQFLQKQNLNFQPTTIQPILTRITQQPGYHDVLQQLQHEFSASNIGYENWRHHQNSWLLQKFQSASESRAAFNQLINVLDRSAWNVGREQVNAHLDNWLQNTWKNDQRFLALLGEEGDGKTWAVALWLAKRLQTDPDFPAVIFLTSRAVPSTIEPQELLAHTITRQLREGDSQYWERRIHQWMQRPPGDMPEIIVVFDGINERYDVKWRALLEKLAGSPWRRQVAVLLTCRSVPWQEQYAPLSYLPVQTFTIPPFDDREFAVALSYHNLMLANIQQSLLPLIRRPRYLDLVIKHRQVMAESGDMTVERLLYEDWKDRIARKTGIPLTHHDFYALIADLAQQASPESKAFSKHEIEGLLPVSDVIQSIQELISGGILIRDPITGKYKVEPRRLFHGFGLLLKQKVHEAISLHQPVEEYIASFLEPHRDMDSRVKIYGAAVIHAIMDENYPEEGKVFLFQLWLEGRNLDKEAQESILAYLPACPNIYAQLVEHVSLADHDNTFAQTLLLHSFLKWSANPKVQAILPATLERWMGFLHPYGFIVQRGRTLEESEKLHQDIEARVGFQLQPGSINFQGYNLSVIEDDGLLRLAKVALTLISHGPRVPFIKAFIVWALSRSLMGRPDEYELVSWVLKTTKENLWNPFKTEIEQLISKNHTVAQQAAYRLLSCFASQAAYQLQHTLPDDLFPPYPMQELYEQDPCTQVFYLWRREDYINCLRRTDLTRVERYPRRRGDGTIRPVPSVRGGYLRPLWGGASVLMSSSRRLLGRDSSLVRRSTHFRSRHCRRRELQPYLIASKMKNLALEPDLLVPADLGARLKPLVGEDFMPAVFWTALGSTSADHQLDEVENALAAFAPEILANIVRNILRDAPNRSEMPLRQLALKIEPNLLIVGTAERQAIEQAWRKLLTHWDSLTESEQQAEDWLFPAILHNLPAEQQLAMLLARPDEALDLSQYKYLFKPLDPQCAEELLKDPSNTDNPRKLQRILWFLSINPEVLSAIAIMYITRFLEHAETETRRFVLELIYKSQNVETIRTVLESSWGWCPEHWFEEDAWGSFLLSEFGKTLSYQIIRKRVHPVYWGYAVEKRGLVDSEVAQYAEDIHTIWQRIKDHGTDLPENFPETEVRSSYDQQPPASGPIGISTDFLKTSFTVGPNYYSSWGEKTSPSDPNMALHQDVTAELRQRTALLQETLRKQAETGNNWFAKRFQKYALKQILVVRSDLVQIWLQTVYENTEVSSRLIFLCRNFYEALLEVLFESDPNEASKLLNSLQSSSKGIQFIDPHTGIECSDYALFQANNHPDVQNIWNDRLERCINDLELFEFALVAQQTGNTSWLKGVVQRGLDSSWTFEQARAMLLLGFLDDPASEATLKKYCDLPQCWLKEVARRALRHWTSNVWARQWFQRFIEHTDSDRAWACFKLFLKCVDRRLWLWERQFLNDTAQNERQQERVNFLSLNRNELKKHIKENEKQLKETFFGEKLLKGQVWPWMNS